MIGLLKRTGSVAKPLTDVEILIKHSGNENKGLISKKKITIF